MFLLAARVVLFGSSANNLYFRNSDIDLCLMDVIHSDKVTRTQEQAVIKNVAKMLRKSTLNVCHAH